MDNLQQMINEFRKSWIHGFYLSDKERFDSDLKSLLEQVAKEQDSRTMDYFEIDKVHHIGKQKRLVTENLTFNED